MKPMNNLDKAKFGQREFNMKHMFILQPFFALFSLPLPSQFCACDAEANLAELVGHDAQQKMENNKTCSKLNSLHLFLFKRRWTDLFFVCVEDLKKILDDAVYSQQKMHTKGDFNQHQIFKER